MQATEGWIRELTGDYHFILVAGAKEDIYRSFFLLYKPFGQEEETINFVEDRRLERLKLFFELRRQFRKPKMQPYVA